MFVSFNEDRVLMLNVEDGAPLLRVMPQVNEIPDDLWNRVRPQLLDKLAVAKGATKAQLTELHVAAQKQGAKGVVGKTMQDISPAEASALVAKTLDVKLLTTWKAVEKRDDVRLDIANQIDELSKRNKSKSKKSEG